MVVPCAFAQEHPNVQPSAVRDQLKQEAAPSSAQQQPPAKAAPAPAKSPSPAPAKAPVQTPSKANSPAKTTLPTQEGAPAKSAAQVTKVAPSKAPADATPPSKASAPAKSAAQASKAAPSKAPAKAPSKAATKTPPKPRAKAASQTPAKASAAKPAPIKATVAKRDPFESLLTRASATNAPPENLPPGRAGLVVSTLSIDGVVKAPNGMLAVVSNPQHRVYFLREGDKLYDGSVDHITLEAVSFHEIGKDAFGKPVEREVTKRLYATSGEQP
jgi:hypothetical protein